MCFHAGFLASQTREWLSFLPIMRQMALFREYEKNEQVQWVVVQKSQFQLKIPKLDYKLFGA